MKAIEGICSIHWPFIAFIYFYYAYIVIISNFLHYISVYFKNSHNVEILTMRVIDIKLDDNFAQKIS